MGILIGYETLLERTSKFLPKRVSVIVKRSIINYGLMRNVHNWLIEGTRLYFSGLKHLE
jgi:hypothetical protein